MELESKSIEKYEKLFLHYFGWLMILVFTLFILGFIHGKPVFLMKLNFVIKIIIASYLIYRFNPYRKEKIYFTELDKRMVFSSSFYILIISFADILLYYITEIHDFFQPYTKPIADEFERVFIL